MSINQREQSTFTLRDFVVKFIIKSCILIHIIHSCTGTLLCVCVCIYTHICMYICASHTHTHSHTVRGEGFSQSQAQGVFSLCFTTTSWDTMAWKIKMHQSWSQRSLLLSFGIMTCSCPNTHTYTKLKKKKQL